MTERNEKVSEALDLTPVKSEMLSQQISMEAEQLALQTSPLVYQQQNIIVEVPVINGEPPAMLHCSRDIGEFSFFESAKICGGTPREDQACKTVEMKQCDEGSSTLNMDKEDQIRRRREQNRFRMRALRASDSEVARRLRENNKFRMRMLRASGSQVAEAIKERNKYRMRELRSARSRVIEKCRSISLDVGESSKKDQFAPSFCAEVTQVFSNIEYDSLKRDFRLNNRTESDVSPCMCLVKEQVQEKPINNLYSEQNQKQSVSEKSISVSSNDLVTNTEESSTNSVCNLTNVGCHCSLGTNGISGSGTLKNEIDSGIREESKMCELQSAVCCIHCGVLGSSDLETSAYNFKAYSREPSIVHTTSDEAPANFDTHFVDKVGQYHRIKIQNDVLSKERSFTHFMRVEELGEQHKLIRSSSLNVNEESVSDLDDQRNLRREKGKLRMRLKRHFETEEEAQRRRERGRLRMRVLRASESEEQAARRRELNRLRMRMKRNSAKE